MDGIMDVNAKINGFVWGLPMLAVFLSIGFMFSVRCGFFQITGIRMWMNQTILACFRRKDVRKTGDSKSISQFQSVCTALAATLGTGNIAGVATAIAAGVPGAVFWMWVSALLGMMTSFAENTLGIRYRYTDADGNWVGGAMVYMEKGLHAKGMAMVYAALCVLASFGIGNMSQANSIADAMASNFQVPPFITGVVMAGIISLVVMGGMKRIAGVTEKVVPFMAIVYMLGAVLVVLFNAGRLPAAVASIFREAFQWKAGIGGAAGYGIMTAMKKGISRGVFTNEAGLGSSVLAHSASDVKEPAVQGMWGIFEVFADTIVMCTITALVILTSGVYDVGIYAGALGTEAFEGLPLGASLTANAFSSVFGAAGGKFVALALTLFAFSTLLGWSYYGVQAISYLFGKKAVKPYQWVFIVMIVVGCMANLTMVWEISDTFNGLMAIPNLIAIVLLSGQAVQLAGPYIRKS